jgi:hypothetical protein
MRLRFSLVLILPVALLSWGETPWLDSATAEASQQQDAAGAKKPDAQTAQSATPTAAQAAPTGVPRGKKLVLKDGSFQLVRNYEKNGDRVRYFSVERGAWEEIPASLVDWDATKKAESTDEKTSEALLTKVHIQESAAKAETPVDVDASLTVAPGVFLPDGEGLFAFESQSKTVKRIEQAGSQVRTDKKTVLKQVLSPIPVVPSKHTIELPGVKASTRLTSSQPEFYLREVMTDPERDSALLRTRRQGDSGPDLALVHATVKGNKRILESIRSLFGQQLSQDRKEISIQRWEVAPDIYRFTLSEPLPPGEYALAEILEDGINMYVWDFGVDAAPGTKTAAH